MSEKDQSVTRLLDDIDLNRYGWAVVDHWDADKFAIGIATKTDLRKLVYISTFRRDPGRFDFESEMPNGRSETGYDVVDRGEDVSFDILLAALLRHLT